MKTKMKRQGSTELPRFAVGALAIAGASAANAATVQISFNASFISYTSGDQLDTDFGGDSVADIQGSSISGGVRVARLPHGSVGEGGVYDGRAVVVMFGMVYWGQLGDAAPVVVRGLVSFSLTDQLVRAGAPTLGWLDVTATGRTAGELGRVELHRFIFDDTTGAAPVGVTTATTGLSEYGATSAVPEASTSLGLLALGAGGILTRRRQKRAA
jgi:hypothetical protein